PAVAYTNKSGRLTTKPQTRVQTRKDFVGVDVFLHDRGEANDLGNRISKLTVPGMKLSMITNRGVKVWPNGLPETFCTDHWRCRFMSTENGHSNAARQVVSLLSELSKHGLEFIKTENLYNFDGEPGYSAGQGQ
ncbi:MAG: NADP-dependent isocitrate dehydrogenase, partial [Gemmataceae bacterium]